MTFPNLALPLQVKATEVWEVRDGVIAYALKASNYERLRLDSFPPQYLVLYTLPQSRARWIVPRDDHVDLLHRAYFLNLAGGAELKPTRQGRERRTKTVYVPVKNRLTAPALLRLFKDACEEAMKLRRM